jgi:hypothetical protein
MRLAKRLCGAALVLLAATVLAPAQTTTVLTPQKSAQRARQLIQEAIQALGGQGYLNVRDQTCVAQVSFFGHSGALDNYEKIYDYSIEPDKERIEYSSKRNIIDVFNGKHGWTLDHGGVSDASPEALADYQAGLHRDINYLFRHRLNEPGLIFRYAGPDVVDLKQVQWVEIVDEQDQTTRIALDLFSHLPIRAVYITRDPVTRERNEEVEYFSNYQPVQGVETPFQDTRVRNGQKTFQAFIAHCSYNTGLEPSLFTKEALEQRWAKLGGKKTEEKRKKEKDKGQGRSIAVSGG